MPKTEGRARIEATIDSDGSTSLDLISYQISLSEYPGERIHRGNLDDYGLQTMEAAWTALMGSPAGTAFRQALRGEVRRVEGI